MSIRVAFVLAILILFATACTPSGCRRTQEPALMPADSLSRNVAATAEVDSLAMAWSSTGPESERLQFPRTVRFLSGETLAVSDARADVIHVFGTDGTHKGTLDPGGLDVPYIAGVRGDTLVVFSAGSDAIDLVTWGVSEGGDVTAQRVEGASRTLQRPSEQTLAYVAASDSNVYAKIVGSDVASTVGRVGPDGVISPAVELPGPYWRHAGFLRIWGDDLASLTGYRPVIDLLPLDTLTARPDSLALVGFDSPMLERSYRFLTGDVDDAPVLTVSAVPVGDELYVLNLRTQTLHVDVFGRDGRIRRTLVGQGAQRTGNYYPRDLAVQRRADTLDVAVVTTSPQPEVLFYQAIIPDSANAATAESSTSDTNAVLEKN